MNRIEGWGNIEDELAFWRDQGKGLAILIERQDDEIARLHDRITEWETSTGLSTSAGDPDGITPEQNERELMRLRSIEKAAIDLVTWVDGGTDLRARIIMVGGALRRLRVAIDEACDAVVKDDI